ncbi:hypothetical protein U1Q18_040809 [Sarracenia purpurea var. burkii]
MEILNQPSSVNAIDLHKQGKPSVDGGLSVGIHHCPGVLWFKNEEDTTHALKVLDGMPQCGLGAKVCAIGFLSVGVHWAFAPMGMNISQGKLSNKFKALESIDSDEYDQWFPALESSEGHRSNPSRVLRNRSSLTPVDLLPSGRSLDDVFRDVAALRHDLLEMVRDQSLNPQGKRTILATVKKLETEEKRVRGPPFDSARLTNLEARIRRLNKIKESAIRDSQAASDAQEKFDKMEKVVKEVCDGSLASLSPCPVASEGKCAKERDEEDEEGDQDKVFCCDSNMSPGDLCCVVEVSEEAPVSTILQAVHTEGLSDSAHQVFNDMPHPVSACKPADKRDTNESDEDEDV